MSEFLSPCLSHSICLCLIQYSSFPHQGPRLHPCIHDAFSPTHSHTLWFSLCPSLCPSLYIHKSISQSNCIQGKSLMDLLISLCPDNCNHIIGVIRVRIILAYSWLCIGFGFVFSYQSQGNERKTTQTHTNRYI